MSKILIEIDSEEETVNVTVDGSVLENVDYISIYPGSGKNGCFSVNINQCEESGDMRKVTTLYCDEDGQMIPRKEKVASKQLVDYFEKINQK